MNDNNDNKNPDVDHILDPKTVVSSTDFTGLLQGLPKDGDEIEQYLDVHSIPNQGGLNRLDDTTDAKVH